MKTIGLFVAALTLVVGSGCGAASVERGDVAAHAAAGDCSPETTTGYAEVNGARLYYEVAGCGHPLVLVHGFTLDTRMWNDQFAVFAEHYRVVRYDMRGFGKSTVPVNMKYDHADDLAGLLDYLGIPRAHLVGLSLGGKVGVRFVLAYPQRVSAFVAVDSALDGYAYSDSFRTSFLALFSNGETHGVARATKDWMQHPLFAPALANPVAGPRLRDIVSDYSGWHWLHLDHVLAHPKPAAIGRLAAIETPTLVVIGELDLPDFHRVADMISSQVAQGKKIVMDGVGTHGEYGTTGRIQRDRPRVLSNRAEPTPLNSCHCARRRDRPVSARSSAARWGRTRTVLRPAVWC